MSVYRRKVYGYISVQNLSTCYIYRVSEKLIGSDGGCPSHENQLDGGKPATAQEPLCIDLRFTFTSFIFLFVAIFANLLGLSAKRGDVCFEARQDH